jgi:PAS domain S-box-containing protein
MTFAESAAASRLAAIVESSADAMIGKTLDGVITSWNAGAARMYGYAPEEVVGRNISVIIPSDRPAELHAMLQRIASGEQVDHYETERIHKNGAVFEVSVSISPIRDREGTIIGASTVARDITDRKRAEAELRDLQERLHLSQRLESVGQLAGGIAHDFNNLLAGIMNYAALAAAGLSELSNRLGLGADETVGTLSHDIAEISSVATRAARLTHQLLIFSRREVVKPEILDLNAVVIDMEELLRRTMGATINLETCLGSDAPATKSDRGHVEQVLMNLAINARDAMTAGGTLLITTARYEVGDDDARQHDISPGAYTLLTVSDTGRGMPREISARAFEPFFTTKGKGEGTGLGLATVHRVVTEAGGRVVISSRPGLGTKVDVMLPATDEIPCSTEMPLGRPPISRGETILVVDDEEIVREPTRRMLGRAGYSVLVASSTEEALRVVNAHAGPIDLLLTDVVMPGHSGRELVADMRRLSPRTKVLYMSGYASDGIDHPASEPALNLIEKPFASDDLMRSVRDILDRG